jgi:hypothetical protein
MVPRAILPAIRAAFSRARELGISVAEGVLGFDAPVDWTRGSPHG